MRAAVGDHKKLIFCEFPDMRHSHVVLELLFGLDNSRRRVRLMYTVPLRQVPELHMRQPLVLCREQLQRIITVIGNTDVWVYVSLHMISVFGQFIPKFIFDCTYAQRPRSRASWPSSTKQQYSQTKFLLVAADFGGGGTRVLLFAFNGALVPCEILDGEAS